MRRARWKRKNVSEGRSARVRTSCLRRWKVSNPARQSGTETRRPWGILQPGESQIYSAPLSAAAGLSLRDKGRHMGRPLQNAGGFLFSCRGGPVCPPVGKPLRGVVSGSGDRSRGYSIFHPGFPLHRTRGAGLTQLSCPARVGRRPAVFVDTDSGAPRQRGGQLHRSTTKKRSFLWTVHGPFSFRQDRKEMGGGMGKPPSRLDSSPIGVISNNFRRIVQYSAVQCVLHIKSLR